MRNPEKYLKSAQPLRFLPAAVNSTTNLQLRIHYWYAMDEIDNLREPKRPYLVLNLAALGQKSMPVGCADKGEHLSAVDSKPDEYKSSNGIGIHSFSKQNYGGDLERGVERNGLNGTSLLASAKQMYEESGSSSMQGSFSQRINGSFEEYSGKIRQCGIPGKEDRLGFPWNRGIQNEFALCVRENQSEISAPEEDMGTAESVKTVPGCSDKVRNANVLKPGWKKPPRPPRPATRPSRERLMKGFSDSVSLRRARLERMRSTKKHKFAKSSSANASFWALLVTLSFCIIIILQGIFSQSSGSSQYSSPASGHRTALPLQNFDSHATVGEPKQAV